MLTQQQRLDAPFYLFAASVSTSVFKYRANNDRRINILAPFWRNVLKLIARVQSRVAIGYARKVMLEIEWDRVWIWERSSTVEWISA